MDVPTPRDDRMKELVLEKEEMEKKHSAELELMEDRMANLAWEKGQMEEYKEEKELLEDRMKEMKEETEKKKSTDDDDGGSALAATKRGLAKGSADNKPVSKKQKKTKKMKTKEPTQEHRMIRVKYEALVKWEREMQTRYTEGFAAEMMARIASNGKMEQFPSEIPHMWTKELVEEAKIGWQKYEETLEVSDKYVKQSTEQWYKEDTDEWIMLDK